MTARLYTIVCDYAGGTFVSQVQAEDQQDALARWAASLKDKRAMGDTSEHIATAACASELHGRWQSRASRLGSP